MDGRLPPQNPPDRLSDIVVESKQNEGESPLLTNVHTYF